jgi:alkylation response protein AidB-like acyl-CoA dehydrogenase
MSQNPVEATAGSAAGHANSVDDQDPAAVAFASTVASALAAAGGNARTVEQYDSLVERRSASDVLRDHRARLVATGLPGLLAPEDADGLGLLEEGGALAALVAVARAAGAVPGPDITAPWAAAPTVLRLAGADHALQAQVAAGDVRLAVADLTGTSAADRTAPGTAQDTVRVVDGEEADGLLVLEPGRIRLVRDAALLPVSSFDPTRPVSTVSRASLIGEGSNDVDQADAHPAGDTLARGERADRIAVLARATGRLVLAAELHGTGQELLRLVVEHLSTRMAFGRPLGSFQALKHRTADLWSELSLVGSLVDEAARLLEAALAEASVDDDPTRASGSEQAPGSDPGLGSDPASGAADAPAEASANVAAALSLASDTVVHGGEEVLQLHGGIGYTWESPVHVLLKRAVASRVRWGSPHELRQEVAQRFEL